MKKYIFLAAIVLFFASDALAQCVCNTVVGVPPNIYKQSAPLRRGGKPFPAPLIGYRKEPTLISNQRGLLSGSSKVCATNNVQITSCPVVGAIGHQNRARCTAQTANVRRRAVALTGSPAIRFQATGGRCVQVPDAGRCVGSNKGLCNTTIR